MLLSPAPSPGSGTGIQSGAWRRWVALRPLVLLLAIIQLPQILLILPIIFYVFSTTSTLGAVAFTLWGVLVSVSDIFLKPLFLGRGVEVPMLVVLIGALGGMIAWGVLGLFVGAVVLTVGTSSLSPGSTIPSLRRRRSNP